ncbi:hypothetical protein CHGG_00488 [Chaetomium globosum CBS 148.51]|uniref:CCHC-type domain-containing protein n=1 Tax=Chaetomium globosum (strain ATCC 6205 / CBS 148.51 / DSM 1962 / NBRC 6347 / NRRL 1970) TaxID=306901 RepID=Q2HH16_CHAGB|nr:uncharacterized protein CHGG_00488 [Chaetomium globosum CBS 148.51]EAQ92253.1 hypothetical protein CHGG_00488 [Chaetomium globosum CBS 148.51]
MAGPTAPAQRGRSVLEQSRHLPPTPPLSPPPSDIEAIKKMVDEPVGLADPEKKGTARGMGQDLLAAVRKMYDASQSQTGNISLANFCKVVAEEVKEAVNGAGTQDKGTWAAVAAHRAVPLQSQPNTPTKILVPTRINKEILVRGRGMPADLAKRTPQETIQAVNQVEAFGEQAEESKRTFAVLLKGVWKKNLQGVTEEEFGKETGLHTVDKVKFRVPRHREATPATMLVASTSQEEARKACDEGVIWRAQLLDCEPYWAALSPTQCYKCWKWGHTQHYCKATPLCRCCGTKAHGEGGREGEAQCPTHKKRNSATVPGLRRKTSGVVRRVPGEVEGPREGQGGLPIPTTDIRDRNHDLCHRDSHERPHVQLRR